jgi:RNA polymerase sigma factor (sigma-70 family)
MDRVTFPEELLKRAREEDAAAFQELYARARTFALRIGISCFGLSADDAEDVSQEVTWSLYQNLPCVERPDSWLYAAVRHQALRLKNARRGERLHAAQACSPYPQDGLTDIWDCVLRLSDRCRKLILHLFYCGYTERELADLQDVHSTTIHKRKKKCFGSLFDLYSGENHGKRVLPNG